MNKTNNFYTILPSNSCPLMHPNNTASKFIVDLQNPIYLDGRWEVAMLDFTFAYLNFPLYSKSKIEYMTKKDVEHDLTLVISNKEKEISIKSNSIVSVSNKKLVRFDWKQDYEIEFDTPDIAHRFGFGFKKNQVKSDKIIYYEKFAKTPEIELVKMKISYTKVKYHTLQFKDELYISDLLELNKYFTTNCSEIFKSFGIIDNQLFQFTLQDDVKFVKFDKALTKTLGLEKQEYTPDDMKDGKILATTKPKIIKYHQQMFIYTSLVEPVIVGDVNVPLLKSVWIDKHENDEVVQVIVENPMYLPIATSCINNIEINIRDDSGKLIKFAKDSKTHLTLHFRKIND